MKIMAARTSGILNVPYDEKAFFSFRCENESDIWYIPVLISEGSNSISISSSWDKQNIMGTTMGMSAFNYVDNPSYNIEFTFTEDLFWEYNTVNGLINNHSYIQTVSKLASLQYPTTGTNNTISQPYIKISFDYQVFRGYFTSVKITQSGMLKSSDRLGNDTVNNYHRTTCLFSGNFVVAPRAGITRNDVANNLINSFGSNL